VHPDLAVHPDVAAQPDLTVEPGDRPADSDGTGTVTGAVRRTWRPGRPLRPSRPPRRRRWSRGLAPTALPPTALPPTAVSRTAVPSTLVPSSALPSGGAPSAAQVFPEAARPLTPRPPSTSPVSTSPPSSSTVATGPTRGTEDTGPQRAPTGSSAAAGPRGAAAVGAPGPPSAFGSGSLWARSLQLRVVTATLLVSVILVGVAGWFVLRQVSAGLVANREASAVGESTVGLNRAQALLADSAPGDPSRLITDLAQTLATQGATGPAGLFDVVVLASSGPTASTGEGTPDATQQYAPRASRDVLPDSVPPALRNAVRGTDDVVWGLGPISYSGGRQPEPGVIAGGEISTADAGTFDVFYLYSMADQVRTLGLLRRNIALAGTFLVVLLAAVAATVTRQVVRPVRAAAGIAERYASGNLTERMQVTGVDDIARLADTFNKMATALEDQFLRLEDLSRVQRRFVSDVSHELRTPLTTVRMAADMLFDDRAELPPQMVRSTELLQDQLDRFESLLVDLLEISRFDAGAAALAAAPTDLRPLVNAAVEAVGPLAAAHGCPLGSPASCGTCWPMPSTTARDSRSRSRSPATTGSPRSSCAITGSGCPRRRSSASSTGSGGPTRPGHGRPAAPASGCRSPRRTPPCTVVGCRCGGCPPAVHRSGCYSPSGWTGRCRPSRCRWSHPMPGPDRVWADPPGPQLPTAPSRPDGTSRSVPPTGGPGDRRTGRPGAPG